MKTKPKNDPGFRLEAKGDAVEIDIYDVIGSGWFGGVSANDVVKALKEHKNVERITVNLNSPGGDAFDGITIYNVLNRHKAHVTVNIDGMAASAASVIAMAGDTINMAENAQMMIHNAWTFAMGNEAELTKSADRLRKTDHTIASTYAARTGGDIDTIKEQMADETWFTAEEAVNDGFATNIAEYKPVSASFDKRIFGSFKHVPEEIWRAIGTQEAPEDTGVNNQNGDEQMPENKMTPDEFARLYPEAVKNWKAEGGIDARKDELSRIAALTAAFPKDPAFALDQAGKGHDVAKAKAEYADVLVARNEQLAAENAELKTKAEAGDGADPVKLAPRDEPKDKYADLPAGERIQAEWSDNHDGCRDKFKAFDAYAGYRKARLTK